MTHPPSPHLAALRRAISDPRLDAYRMGPGEEEIDLLARYLWNMALAESLYPVLQCLEVAFRNALHSAISSMHGAHWFDDAAVLVDSAARTRVRDVKDRLVVEGKPHNPGRIVAGLEFGFWTSLLNKRYARSPATPANQHPLWPRFVAHVFPHFSPPAGNPAAGRPALAARFNAIRHHLRNRISHHEPIWNGWYDRGARTRTPLAVQHEQVLEALGWISPELRATVSEIDRFHEVHRLGTAPYSTVLAKLVG